MILQSSGSKTLDRAALKAIAALLPYPDPPAETLRLTIPVTFALGD